MGSYIYQKQDVANILMSTATASEGSMGIAIQVLGGSGITGVEGMDVEKAVSIYRQGVRNTLLSVGLAFGLMPIALPDAQKDAQVAPGLAGLLWAEIPQER